MIGELARYIYTGNRSDGKSAKYFWDQVTMHHSFATGGHGRNEYFGPADQLNDMVDGRTAETCNVYNMIKMSRTLFSVEPEVRYADFHERALFNHILRLKIRTTADVCYMVPVGAECSTSTRTSSKTSPAAWAREWKATRCTATGSTTSQATSCG